MTKEESSKIVNFMTPEARVLALEAGHISQIVKLIIPLKTSFLPPGVTKTTCVYSYDDQGRICHNCNFHDH